MLPSYTSLKYTVIRTQLKLGGAKFLPVKYLWMKGRLIFGRVRKIAKNDCYQRRVCTSVGTSVRKKQLVLHWTDFYEI